jgi:hypothetical protein
MRRAVFWMGVALTIALVAFGIWYYVHDDYPFQLTPGEITGLSYRSVTAGGAVSGYIVRPPAELADWISSMEKDSSEQSVPATTEVTVVRSDGPSLQLSIGGLRGYGRWVDANGAGTAPIGVRLSQAFLWYLRGVGDALAATRHAVTPRSAPNADGPSPTASLTSLPKSAPTGSLTSSPTASPTRTP